LLATDFSVISVLFLKGKVNIVAKPGVTLEIPDGAVLENKVKS
jgi:UTP--glucose-1-phosphate uridylyltransferase